MVSKYDEKQHQIDRYAPWKKISYISDVIRALVCCGYNEEENELVEINSAPDITTKENPALVAN